MLLITKVEMFEGYVYEGASFPVLLPLFPLQPAIPPPHPIHCILTCMKTP